MVLVALYALGTMAEASYESNIFTPPLVAFLIYSLISFFRSVRNINLYGDDDTYNDHTTYGYYSDGYTANHRNTNYTKRNSGKTDNTFTSTYVNSTLVNEDVTTYGDNKPKERNIEKRVIKTYPDKKKVLEEIKELEKNPFWKLKRWVYNIFGNDITAKMYDPVVSVEYINKEDDTRFMPNNSDKSSTRTLVRRTDVEYDSIVKRVGRSFDVAVTDENTTIVIEDEDGTTDSEREGTTELELVQVEA